MDKAIIHPKKRRTIGCSAFKEFRQIVTCPRCKGQPSITHCGTCNNSGYVHVFAVLDLGRMA